MNSSNKTNKKLKTIILILIVLAIIVSGGIISYLNYSKERKVLADALMRKAMYDKILDSASVSPTTLNIDYKKQILTSSPLIFGGVHLPYSGHQDAWDKISESGVTMVRRDFFMEQILPENITLEDYKNNINDIQNPANWKLGKDRYKAAKSRGMKVMGIIDYVPKWLTFSGTQYGVPKDWNVYKDIVKKTYRTLRDDLDLLEIWNEPTFAHFNDVTNSGKTMEEAYIELAKHTIEAIREVDKESNDGKIIPLGGLVADNPIYAGNMLKKMINEKEIMNNLSFISYHTYGHPEPTSKIYREILNENGYSNMPLYLTEWNYSSDERTDNPFKTGNEAIIYTANKLLSFIEEELKGANYYMLEPVGFDSPNIGIKYMGFYRWKNGQSELLPQARTWRILSKQMGLGLGEGKIYEIDFTKGEGERAKGEDERSMIQEEGSSSDLTKVALNAVGLGTDDEELNTVAFVNAKNQTGLAVVNSSDTSQVMDIKLNRTGIEKFANVKVYYANGGNTAEKPVYEGLVKAVNGNIRFSFYVPAETVMGVVFEEEKEWFDFLN